MRSLERRHINSQNENKISKTTGNTDGDFFLLKMKSKPVHFTSVLTFGLKTDKAKRTFKTRTVLLFNINHVPGGIPLCTDNFTVYANQGRRKREVRNRQSWFDFNPISEIGLGRALERTSA